ncbi:MAG: Phage tail tape measure protein family, core region [Mucilaginibacter sp.]|nr:Phage tail tape measure protein family, core region [Mucilaginibacter sp.]
MSNGAKNVARDSAMVGLALAVPLLYAAKEAAAFEKMMAKVNTLNGVSGQAMITMNKQVLDITKKIPVTLEDVTAGLYIINSAGIKGANGIDMVTNASKLAVAGLGTVPQAADMMSSVFNVFSSEGLKASEIANKLALVVQLGKTHIDQMSSGFGSASVIVQNAGIKLDEFLASVSALTVMGNTASEAYTNIQGATIALLKPSTTMMRVFRQFGIKDGKTFIHTMGGLVPAMQAVNKEVTKLHINGAKAWGRKQGFMASMALTGNAHGHFIDNLQAMKNQPTELDHMFSTMLSTTDSQWQLLKNNMRVFTIEIGTKLLPVLNKLMNKITPIVDSIINWMDKNPGWTQTIVTATAGLAALLLVVSPLAMGVGLAADGMRIYAMWTAKSAAAALASTASLDAQALSIGLVSDGLITANAAATSFLATLSALAAPAAIVGFVAWQAFKGINRDIAEQHAATSGGYKNYYDYADSKDPYRFAKQNMKLWSDRHNQNTVNQAYIASSGNGFRIPDLLKTKEQIDFDKGEKAVLRLPTARELQDTTVHIIMHDPAGIVKDVKTPGGSGIRVTVTPTSGVQGKQ